MVAPLNQKTAFHNAVKVPAPTSVATASNSFDNIHSGFAADTNIMTSLGDVKVQNLKVGARVITRDHGMQTLRWIGSHKVRISADDAPIMFQKAVLKNTRDLILSPQHRILFKGEQAELMFGQSEVLVPAKTLLNNDRVYQIVDGFIEYYHVLFDRHEIIYSEGVSTESYLPTIENIKNLDQDTRENLYDVFPNLRTNPENYGHTARTCLNTDEAYLLNI